MTYEWDSQKWVAAGGGVTGDFLPLAGGSMLGPLNLFQDPLASLEAVPKRYLDAAVGAVATGIELYGVFDATTGGIEWHSASGQAGNALPPPNDIALEGKYLICGVGGSVPPTGATVEAYWAGDWLICNGVDAWYHIFINFAALDAGDVKLNPAVLGASNVQAGMEALAAGQVPPTPYVLPPATTTVLGGVKPDGATINAAADGTITATVTGGATVGDVAPASPAQGALWFDSVSLQLFVWYDDGSVPQWISANNFA